MITVQGISKFFGSRELFKDVSFHLRPAERIGLIGSNGAGKTTLFQILTGSIQPDTGSVTAPRNLSIGYLPQQWIPCRDKTVLAHAIDVHSQLNDLQSELRSLQQALEREKDPESIGDAVLRQAALLEKIEHLGGYDIESRAAKILAGLGFDTSQLHQPAASLSGGWIMRLELSRLLLSEPDLLLLDEPTNHLDLESLMWLEQYLLTTSSAILLVSHDRSFLNKVVQRIFELELGHLHEYSGNYDSYLEEKAVRQEIHAASYKNQQDRIRQVERFIERNRYRKSTASRAQSRIRMLDKMDRIEAPSAGLEQIHFDFPEPPRSGKRVFELSGVHKSYGNCSVYSGIDLVIERGDRIAFIGENGAGKSTLLKMLAGVESVSGGDLTVGLKVVSGYYAQHQWEQLHSEWTVIGEVSSIAGDMTQTRLRGLLGAFLFKGEEVMKKVSVLSGGEKARLILCKLLLQRPNVLLLDEPTNHLDIPSRVVLEKALENFPGTICFISHDRHFINAVANRVLFVNAGRVRLFPGNYDDFLNIWAKSLEAESTGCREERSGVSRPPSTSGFRNDRHDRRARAELRNELYRLKRPLQQSLEELETELEAAHHLLDSLNNRLADPATYRNGGEVQNLRNSHRLCTEKIRQLTGEWEVFALRLEAVEEEFWKEREKVI
ncbi:MAG: ABC-F family ATP-binding cassette domain-containing protein [Syntrophobacteraceae bacterium]|nr:ABC-F family ATP-binding cassette domain-containing protein [Syntrophobacteraceae bacterium]